MRRIVELVAVPEGPTYGRELIARCDDETIWSLIAGTDGEWEELPGIPQGESSETKPGVRPVEPEPGPSAPEPGAGPEGWRAVVRGRGFELTAQMPQFDRPLTGSPAAAYLVKFRATIPASLVGAHAEFYLCGIPALGGVQFFVRAKNGWLCVGADQAWPWLWELSQRLGQPLESGNDGSQVTEGYQGWCGMRLARLQGDIAELDLDVQIPGTGNPVTLQIGEDKAPKPGSKTVLPIGVKFESIEVWAR